MALRNIIQVATIVVASSAALLVNAFGQTKDAPRKLTVFIDPSPNFTGALVAEAKGYFKEAGLDVDLKQAVSGASSLQAFKIGAADIAYAGELPAMNYWLESKGDFRFIMVVNRNTKNQAAVVANSIQAPKDIKGKTIATRVGSTSSWFISEFLKKNGLSPSDVTIKNLEPQLLPTALCRGEIDGFFGYNPIDLRALEICPTKVHRLSYGDGYIQSYIVFGARPEWLSDEKNRKATQLFIGAFLKGEEYAKANFAEAADIIHRKLGISKDLIAAQWKNLILDHGFDSAFHQDFCMLTNWMRSEGRSIGKLEFDALIDGRPLAAVEGKTATIPNQTCAGS